MRTILSVLLLVSVYLLVAMGPAIVTMCANYLIDPSTIWVCIAEGWLSANGVPYAPLALVTSYSLVVFYPAIRFSLFTCGPLFR
jgi:hypothetical protein